MEADEPGRDVFLAQAAAHREALAEPLLAVLRGAPWRGPDGEAAAPPEGPELGATTFGEEVTAWAEVAVGGFRLRYPAPGARRGSGLALRDPATAAVAGVPDLGEALMGVPGGPPLAEALGLAAAQAAWPEDRFRWTGSAVARRWRVVGEVERWPGEIQLQAARTFDPALRIGDWLWLADRERLPACWVLDLLRG